jgi:hypothetical protein
MRPKVLVIHSQAGISLVEIMIAVGVVAIISSAIATMVSNMSEMEYRMRLSQDGRSLQYELEQIARQESCGIVGLDTLNTNVGDFASHKPIPLSPGPSSLSGLGLTLNSNSFYGILEVVSIQIEPWLNKSTDPYTSAYIRADAETSTNFLDTARIKAQLTISYVRKGEESQLTSANPPKINKASQTIFLSKVPGNNSVTDCYSEDVELFTHSMCDSLGGHWDASVDPAACLLPNADSG